MTEIISSVHNPKIKLVKSLLQKKNRVKNMLYTVEGIKSVSDAYDAGADIEMIILSEESKDYADIFEKIPCFVTSASIIENISDTKTPQGILAVIKMQKTEKKFDRDKLYLCCDNVRDPGNLGTIIRTADAAGFGGVLLYGDCADLYSPKTVRSSMGSFFHIPVFENVSIDDINILKSDGFCIYCGALSDNTISYTDADYTLPVIICVGNEANGISEEMQNAADKTIKIPISGAAESLNVGIAAAVLMYEAVRQRNEKKY